MVEIPSPDIVIIKFLKHVFIYDTTFLHSDYHNRDKKSRTKKEKIKMKEIKKQIAKVEI